MSQHDDLMEERSAETAEAPTVPEEKQTTAEESPSAEGGEQSLPPSGEDAPASFLKQPPPNKPKHLLALAVFVLLLCLGGVNNELAVLCLGSNRHK